MTSDFSAAIIINENEITVDLLKLFNIIIENTVEEIVIANGHAIIDDIEVIQYTMYEHVNKASEYVEKEKGSRKLIFYLPENHEIIQVIKNKTIVIEDKVNRMCTESIDRVLLVVNYFEGSNSFLKTFLKPKDTSIRNSASIATYCKYFKTALEPVILVKLINKFRNLNPEYQIKSQGKLNPKKDYTTQILMGAAVLAIIFLTCYYYIQRTRINGSQKIVTKVF